MWDRTGTARPEDVDAVVTAALQRAPRCGGTVVVAIDGPSGAGKSTLARGVVAALGAERTEVVHLDRLYPGWDGLAVTPSLLADGVLAPISRGEPAGFRPWSWVRDEWRPWRPVATRPYLVVEGCGASVGPARAYTALAVFVTADRDLRRERGLARDGETYRPHWQRWADQETALFTADRTRERADLVIDTTAAASTL